MSTEPCIHKVVSSKQVNYPFMIMHLEQLHVGTLSPHITAYIMLLLKDKTLAATHLQMVNDKSLLEMKIT